MAPGQTPRSTCSSAGSTPATPAKEHTCLTLTYAAQSTAPRSPTSRPSCQMARPIPLPSGSVPMAIGSNSPAEPAEALTGSQHSQGILGRMGVLQAARGIMVGRDAELVRLLALLDDAEAGQAVVVLVSGDAGGGKSRLTAE